jgi:hypothetical protein
MNSSDIWVHGILTFLHPLFDLPHVHAVSKSWQTWAVAVEKKNVRSLAIDTSNTKWKRALALQPRAFERWQQSLRSVHLLLDHWPRGGSMLMHIQLTELHIGTLHGWQPDDDKKRFDVLQMPLALRVLVLESSEAQHMFDGAWVGQQLATTLVHFECDHWLHSKWTVVNRHIETLVVREPLTLESVAWVKQLPPRMRLLNLSLPTTWTQSLPAATLLHVRVRGNTRLMRTDRTASYSTRLPIDALDLAVVSSWLQPIRTHLVIEVAKKTVVGDAITGPSWLDSVQKLVAAARLVHIRDRRPMRWVLEQPLVSSSMMATQCVLEMDHVTHEQDVHRILASMDAKGTVALVAPMLDGVTEVEIERLFARHAALHTIVCSRFCHRGSRGAGACSRWQRIPSPDGISWTIFDAKQLSNTTAEFWIPPTVANVPIATRLCVRPKKGLQRGVAGARKPQSVAGARKSHDDR